MHRRQEDCIEYGKWYWSTDDDEVIVEITAWKELDEPYQGN